MSPPGAGIPVLTALLTGGAGRGRCGSRNRPRSAVAIRIAIPPLWQGTGPNCRRSRIACGNGYSRERPWVSAGQREGMTNWVHSTRAGVPDLALATLNFRSSGLPLTICSNPAAAHSNDSASVLASRSCCPGPGLRALGAIAAGQISGLCNRHKRIPADGQSSTGSVLAGSLLASAEAHLHRQLPADVRPTGLVDGDQVIHRR